MSARWRRELTRERHGAVARFLKRDQALRRAGKALGDAGICWVVIKGMQLAYTLYDDPTARDACGIDLLVAANDRCAAVRALERVGFPQHYVGDTGTHEVLCSDGVTNIDLHWHLLRPGRTAIDIDALILSNRVAREGLFFPDDRSTLLILLVHPAICKQVTMDLKRALDLALFLRGRAVTPPDAAALSRQVGLSVAAWSMLRWTGVWFRSEEQDAYLAELAPASWRRAYLEQWLMRNPYQLFLRHPNLVRVLFNAALQDSAGRAASFVAAQAMRRLMRRRVDGMSHRHDGQ